MRHFLAAAALLLGLVGPDTLTAQLDQQEWGWRATLARPQETGGMAALPLDEALYDRLLIPPHDLRLVDQGAALVPHVVQCGRTTAAATTVMRPVQIINRTFTPKRFSRVVLDFGESALKNKLKVDLSGQNYRRRVTIEGGEDGRTWETVQERNFLFDAHVPGQSLRLDTLAFPENSFRYLRLTVENMADDPERVEINGANAFYEEPAGEPQLARVQVVSRNIEQDKKTSSTVITLDLGFRNLPLQSVALAIENARFDRAYTIEGRNTITHKIYRRTEEAWRAEERETPWSSVAQGQFYRREYQGKISEMTEAAIPHAAYRYLRVTILNRDDSPLEIKDVAVKRRTCALLFKAQAGAQYTLYGGNGKAGAAAYDFARLVPGMDIATLPQVNHGAIETLKPEEAQVPWSERYSYLITGGVVVAVLLMLGIILPVLKKEMGSGK
ncbi:MAG TPA: DUF3999 family protein [Candidatus Binatia bacterium]